MNHLKSAAVIALMLAALIVFAHLAPSHCAESALPWVKC